jgi:hypothetical protein
MIIVLSQERRECPMEIPFRVKLRFIPQGSIVPTKPQKSAQDETILKKRNQGVILDAKEFDALLAFEPKLFKWLNLNKKHVTLFAIDPISSIVQAGFQTDTVLFGKLKRVREKNIAIEAPLTGAKLSHVTIKAGSVHYVKGR